MYHQTDQGLLSPSNFVHGFDASGCCNAYVREPSNYDEISMQHSLLFSDSLKDLKNLRSQLYSAAEYFEMYYTKDDQKQIVVETLKDYTIKALVNTIDHLGSVTYKVNDLLDEKVEEVLGTEIRVSCIEQRLRTCQEYIDHEGISQQSLVINTPKYHKRYILPVGETMHGANRTKLKYLGCSLDDKDDWDQFRNAVRATIRETPTSSVRQTPTPSVRKGRSPSPSPRPPQRSSTFSFTATTPKKELEKRTISPHRFPLLRSGSMSRPTTPNKSRPTTPNSAGARRRYPSEPRKSASMRLQTEKDIEQVPSKSKRLLKALLSRKSKKDETVYTYLDEY
ncbi:Protein ABIL3 [Hibiscus syriacus]|uniref:Protein ABIL3 n=1 Tax=Hibiscus syriacus TaxID=106335 RepID=A0A6A3AV45_HIBSY|nr:protein ABIL2-like isoform X2 [Hibiscus syriacus]KAE8708600.1 Protein ABIL3 [Hibiscus syriacus]